VVKQLSLSQHLVIGEAGIYPHIYLIPNPVLSLLCHCLEIGSYSDPGSCKWNLKWALHLLLCEVGNIISVAYTVLHVSWPTSSSQFSVCMEESMNPCASLSL
jgi:hypothetical protein